MREDSTAPVGVVGALSWMALRDGAFTGGG